MPNALESAYNTPPNFVRSRDREKYARLTVICAPANPELASNLTPFPPALR